MTHSLEVGNRPAAYIPEAEEEEEWLFFDVDLLDSNVMWCCR
jgi:hypothetical protein